MRLLTLLRSRLPRPLRPYLSRRSLLFWSLTAVAAVVTATTVARAVGRADAAAARGAAVPVLVVRAPVSAGERLDDTNTALTTRRAADVPAGAVAEAAVGSLAVTPLVPGEVVVAARLAPAGLSPAAALVPAGHRGVAVPVADAALPVTVGDRVDVLATSPFASSEPGGSGGEARVVATGALVVLVAERSVVVAVPEPEITTVVGSLAAGSVLLVLRGAP